MGKSQSAKGGKKEPSNEYRRATTKNGPLSEKGQNKRKVEGGGG